MVQFGVDEAGKGPAFGSMFAAAVWVADRTVLPEGIADSKRLSPARREDLASRLRADKRVRIGVAEITPERIDDPATDMNSLAVAAHAEAIAAAVDSDSSDVDPDSKTDPVAVLCDACDTDADRFARRVAEACPLDVAVDAAHGADDADPLVGAASIVAKVERDAHVAALADECDAYDEIGSGYPGDPKTRGFLESYVADHGDLPSFARRSWATCADVLAEASQTRLEGFE